MAETVSIIEISTGKSVQNIGQLKEYIDSLKKSLNDVDKTFEENKKDAEELRAAQAALRDAMYSTTTSADDLIKASENLYDENGKLVGSYNAVVKQMAALKSAWRATTDEATRNSLGKEIDKLNNSLKDMDASVGNFSRNVGNYESHWKGLAKQTDALDKGFKAMTGGLGGVKGGLEGIAASPALATIGILASVAMKLADSLKENETAMAGIKKGMDALQPVMDFFSGLLETIAGWVADLITKAAAFLSSSGIFQKIIGGVVGVGNAVLKFVVAPFKAVIAAIKVFQEEGVKGLGNAAKAFAAEMKTGVSFKSNYEAGEAVGDALIAGAGSKKKKAKDTGKDVGKDMAEGVVDGVKDVDLSAEIDKALDAAFAEWEKGEAERNKAAEAAEKDRLAKMASNAAYRKQVADLTIEDDRERAAKLYEIEQDSNQRRMAALKTFRQAALDRGDLEAAIAYEKEIADTETDIELAALKEKKRIREQDTKDAEAQAKARMKILSESAKATSGLLNSIADLYEASGNQSAQQAAKVKGLRIASATIDTISGAIAAYMGAVETIPGPAGVILGAVQAATVTAAGLANIAKIRSTAIPGAASESGTSAAPDTGAFVAPPSVQTDVNTVRNITSASEEERLNRMAAKNKVYLVTSELEANQEDTRVTLQEASF